MVFLLILLKIRHNRSDTSELYLCLSVVENTKENNLLWYSNIKYPQSFVLFCSFLAYDGCSHTIHN